MNLFAKLGNQVRFFGDDFALPLPFVALGLLAILVGAIARAWRHAPAPAANFPRETSTPLNPVR